MPEPEDDLSDFDFDETDVLLPADATTGQDKGAQTLTSSDSAGAGLHFNLIPDASVANAPSWFVPSVQTAANLLQQNFSDNITVNISYGWGTISGNPIANPNTALGGAHGFNISYATVKSWLAADAKSADDALAVASLPNSSSAFPNGRSSFGVSTAQEKALGHFTGDPSALDGEVGFGTGWTAGSIVGAALHELTHALGRVSSWSMDLFRFSAPGVYQFALGSAAYFSVNGGTTHLANFGQTSDTGDWLGNGNSSAPFSTNDPFNESINSSSNALTAVDLTVMDVLGFDRAGSVAPRDDYANSLTDTASPLAQVAVNGVATGTLEVTGDRDWFRVQLTAGVTYTISLEGAATAAGSLSDPYLRLHDSAGSLLAENDDASSSNPNSLLTFVAATTGTYYVEAGAFSDTGTGTYRVGVSGTAAAANHAPVINSNGGGDTASVSIAENTTAVTTVAASDPDAGTTLAYSIVGGADQAMFRIDPSSGALSFVTAPNFEAPADSDRNNSYLVQVRASDGSLFDDQTLTVTVTNVNEAPVITLNGGGDTATVSITENVKAVTTVTASDPDAGTTLTFSIIGGGDSGKFQIGPSSGALSFIAAPNFEAPTDSDHNNSYIVQVRASDGSLADDQTITVNVTDVLETSTLDAGFHGDFGGDHKADLLLRAPSGVLTLDQMNGGQIASSTIVGTSGNEWHIVSIGDFDGSGTSDLLWRGDNGMVATWLMNGAQILSNTSFGVSGNEWHIIGAADFGGDGKADILWHGDNGTLALWQMNGNQITSNASLGTTGNEWHVVALADFGGDHKSDILWRSDGGMVALWQMDGSQVVSSTGLGTVAPQLHVVGAGDFNGDGKADILWRADDGAISLWQMNGGTIQSSQSIGAVGNEWHVDGTGDFNGDGKADILWRGNDGTALLWTMDGAHISSQQIIAPLAADSALSVHHYDLV